MRVVLDAESSMDESDEDDAFRRCKHMGFGSGQRRACGAKPMSRDQDLSDQRSSSVSSCAEIQESESPSTLRKAQPPRKEKRRGQRRRWRGDEGQDLVCGDGRRGGGDQARADAYGAAETRPVHELEVLLRLAAKRRL